MLSVRVTNSVKAIQPTYLSGGVIAPKRENSGPFGKAVQKFKQELDCFATTAQPKLASLMSTYIYIRLAVNIMNHLFGNA